MDSIPGSSNTIDSTETSLDTITSESIQFADGGLDNIVDYGSDDSLDLDSKNELVHLYGNAYVNYEDLSLKANYIIVDLKNEIAIAEGYPDSSGTIAGFPKFKNDSQDFEAKKIRFNFNTEKLKIYEIASKQGDLHVRASETKFISSGNDSTVNDVGYSRDAILTTCDHPTPHFGIRSRKQKVVPDKLVVVGVSNIEIASVPTPFILPFGFFPITKSRKHGLIIPRDYEFSQLWGFGLRDVGYYFPISDYMDARVTGDIYFKGSWGLSGLVNYKKRYKYAGNFNFGYSNRFTEASNSADITKQKSYRLVWSHSQDNKAHPTINFSASVNFESNRFDQRNFNDANNVLNNSYRSNISFTKSFKDKPYSLTASVNHSQNTRSRQARMTLPNFNFNLRRIYPFKRKERVGEQKWYEKITYNYSTDMKNEVIATDTTLFDAATWKDARYGIQHKMSTNATFNVFKYFQLTPRANYREVWYFKSLKKEFDETLQISNDTTFDASGEIVDIAQDTTFGEVVDLTKFGFQPWREFDAGVSMNTQIFGTLNLKSKKLKGVRHVVKPSVSFSYRPDYSSSSFGYIDTVRTDTRPAFDQKLGYQIFSDGIYGRPSVSGEQMNLNYTIGNLLEAKYFSRKDSSDKKVKIFDNFTINGSYNFAADSLRFSKLRATGRTSLFKGILALSYGVMYDFYSLDEYRNRVNKFEFDESGKILRFEEASIAASTRLTIGQIREFFVAEKSTSTSKKKGNSNAKPNDLIGVFENFRINHEFQILRSYVNGVDTVRITRNNLSMRGSIQLTNKWRINVGNIGYDFNSKRITYPDFTFYRDLHCWEMGLSWRPDRQTYNFYIRVKPSTLGFIDVPYRKNNVDTFDGF